MESSLPILNKSFKTPSYKALITLIILVLLSVFAWPFFVDDALDDGIAVVVYEFNSQDTLDNNGSVYQLGMWVKVDALPYEAGLWRLKQYEKALKNNDGATTTLKFEDYPKDRWIKKLNQVEGAEDLLCNFREYQCLERIYNQSPANSKKLAALLSANAANIEKYDGQMQYDQFQLYTDPMRSTFEIPFGPGSNIIKLKLMSIIQLVASNNVEQAISQLAPLIDFQQKVLEQTPYATVKITGILEYSSILDTVAFLIGKTEKSQRIQWAGLIERFSLLQSNQFNMNRILKRRFVAAANGWDFLSIENIKASSPDSSGILPLFILFKPNRTLNVMYQSLLQSLDDGGAINFNSDNIKQSIDYTNVIGSTLIDTTTFMITGLTDELTELKIKQRMIKHLYEQNNGQPATFNSPYTGKPGFNQDEQFCVSTDDVKYDVCITAFQTSK